MCLQQSRSRFVLVCRSVWLHGQMSPVLFLWPCVCLAVAPFICCCFCVFICLQVWSFVYLRVSQFMWLPLSLSVWASGCLVVCLRVSSVLYGTSYSDGLQNLLLRCGALSATNQDIILSPTTKNQIGFCSRKTCFAHHWHNRVYTYAP